jgi:hypothetical protein
MKERSVGRGAAVFNWTQTPVYNSHCHADIVNESVRKCVFAGSNRFK